MKASLFAVVWLLLVIILPIHAATNQLNTVIPAASQKLNAKVDLNKADINTLAKAFKGIGRKRAEAIIKYRESNGSFKSVEELSHVRGLGKQFVEKHLLQLQEVFTVS
ncbi:MULTISPECIES: ComEA family DNA-binding protein [Legionella]|uniref:Competence protein ComEA n=1 Tax=Legionella donaldsonii TaxID=45060 RepID=A0A378JF73_9GAMM|nr:MULTISPECIES: helix-hairpin-helix domain-containing protein [Legionella]MCC5016078.1 helix-hairpin-helix domain-containing protein [Legionella sp. 31fI33]STX43310.1 competence protein ComEA [Legionella donaldsonii]